MTKGQVKFLDERRNNETEQDGQWYPKLANMSVGVCPTCGNGRDCDHAKHDQAKVCAVALVIIVASKPRINIFKTRPDLGHDIFISISRVKFELCHLFLLSDQNFEF